MVNTALIGAVGVIIYLLGVHMASKKGLISLPGEHSSIVSGMFAFGTRRGIPTIDRIATYRTFWRVWNWVGVTLLLTTLVGGVGLLCYSAYQTFKHTPEPTMVNNPVNMLVIPGVNDFLPLRITNALLIGLLVGMLVHELGHGISCRVDGVRVERLGTVLLGIIPIGAFVEPDEEQLSESSVRHRLRVYSAGIMNNYVLTLGAFFALVALVGIIAPASGVPIAGSYPGGPADNAGIQTGDRILKVDGESVANATELREAFIDPKEPTHTVTIYDATPDGGTVRTVNVSNKPYVFSAPEQSGLPVGSTIQSVNGTPTATPTALYRALSEHRIASITTEEGKQATLPVGVLATATTSSGLYRPGDSTVYVVAVNGQQVLRPKTANAYLNQSGAETLTYYQNGTRNRVITSAPSLAKAGLKNTEAFSGIGIRSPAVNTYNPGLYLSLITGENSPLNNFFSGVFGRLWLLLTLPIGKLAGFPSNFVGFAETVNSFYTVPGASEAVTNLVLETATVLFWIVWVNFNLAIFNAFPIAGLDGGKVFHTLLEGAFRETQFNEDKIAKYGTIAVSLFTATVIAIVVVGPYFLS